MIFPMTLWHLCAAGCVYDFPHDSGISVLLDVFMIFPMTLCTAGCVYDFPYDSGISVLLDVFMIFPMTLWHLCTAGCVYDFPHDPLASLYCWMCL